MIQVFKIGGNVVDNPVMLRDFLKDFAEIPGPKVLVHGGGVMASQMVFSLRSGSATTRLVVMGSKPLATHSTEA